MLLSQKIPVSRIRILFVFRNKIWRPPVGKGSDHLARWTVRRAADIAMIN